jgi:GNAT superfamily N-acetyltransferase
MTPYKASFIKVPTHTTNGVQTQPVEPHERIPDSDIQLLLCTAADAPHVAAGMYRSFPDGFWDKMEPLSIRDPDQAARERRMATRLLPTFHNPHMKFVKAVHVPSNQVVGIAGWAGPGMAVHNVWRRSAVEFYGYKEIMGWSDEEVDEMWSRTSVEAWDGNFGDCDRIRKELMGDEPHWFLAPLLTWPEFQGRGIGSMLIKWATEQADATDPPTPLYLESAPTARAIYMHHGFVPQGPVNFVRRGPAVVRGLEAEAEKKDTEIKKVDIDVVEKEADAALAS